MVLRVVNWVLLVLPALVLGSAVARMLGGRGWTSTDVLEGLVISWLGLVAAACATAVRAGRAWAFFAVGHATAVVAMAAIVWDTDVPDAVPVLVIASSAVGHLALLPPHRGTLGRFLRWTAVTALVVLAGGFLLDPEEPFVPAVRVGLAFVVATAPAAALLASAASGRFRHPARPDEFRPATCPACRAAIGSSDPACPECGMRAGVTVRSPRCGCGRIPRTGWKVLCGDCGATLGPRTFDVRGSGFLTLSALLLGTVIAAATADRTGGWFWHIEVFGIWWLALAATILAAAAARPEGRARWAARATLLVAAASMGMILFEAHETPAVFPWIVAVLVGQAMLLPAIPNDPPTTGLRRAAWLVLTLVGTGLLASLFDLDDRLGGAAERLFDATLYFLCLAAALLSMALPPLVALRTPRPPPLTATLTCPCCASAFDAPAGVTRCPICALEFELTLTEHRCACGYLLSKLRSDRCPECGRPAPGVPGVSAAVPAAPVK